MPPKKRKQDDSAAEADDAKPEPEIDHAQSAIEHISHCTMEELKLVNGNDTTAGSLVFARSQRV